jgi:hypothetical protein
MYNQEDIKKIVNYVVANQILYSFPIMDEEERNKVKSMLYVYENIGFLTIGRIGEKRVVLRYCNPTIDNEVTDFDIFEAEKVFDEGKYDECLSKCKSIINSTKKVNLKAYTLIGNVYMTLGEEELANLYFEVKNEIHHKEHEKKKKKKSKNDRKKIEENSYAKIIKYLLEKDMSLEETYREIEDCTIEILSLIIFEIVELAINNGDSYTEAKLIDKLMSLETKPESVIQYLDLYNFPKHSNKIRRNIA